MYFTYYSFDFQNINITIWNMNNIHHFSMYYEDEK